MRNLICFLLVLAQCTFSLAALPPTTIKGQSDSNKSTTFNFEVPFHQATKTSATTGLIETGNTNMLKNPGFEAGLVSWAASGGTLAEATGSDIGYSRGATWDANDEDQTLCSDAVAIPEMFKGQNGELSVRVKVPSGTATHELYVTDGANVLASDTIISSDSFAPVSLPFIFPSSGNVQACLKSVAADEPLIALDDWYLGPNRNIGTIQQATFVGAALFGGDANVFIDSTSPVDVVDATAFGAATRKLVGSAQPHETPDIFGAKFDVTPGRYVARFHAGAFKCSAPAGGWQLISCFFIVRVSGTATVEDKSGGVLRLDEGRTEDQTHSNSQNEITFEFTLTSPGIVSLELVAFVTDPDAFAQAVRAEPEETTPYSLTLYRYPTESEQVMRLGQGVDLMGAVLPYFTDKCPAGTIEVDGSQVPAIYQAFINRTGMSTLPNAAALVPRGIGTRTINGRTKTGPSVVGEIQEDQFQGHHHSMGTKSFIYSTSGSNNYGPTGNTGGGVDEYNPNAGMSVIDPKTDGVNGTPRTGDETRVSSFGVRWCAAVASGQQPLVKHAVTTDSPGLERVERVKFTCAATSSIASKSGDWVTSISNISGGACTLTLTSGKFSAAPTCTGTISSFDTSGNVWSLQVKPISATQIDTFANYHNGTNIVTATEYDVNMICVGPK